MTGKELKKLRNDLKLRQQDLADKFDVTKRTVVNWENGTTTIPLLVGEMLITMKENISPDDLDGKPHIISVGHGGSLTEVSESDYEIRPVIKQFPRYNYTIEVRGNSMYPDFKSGDMVACLDVTNSPFFQQGRTYILSTSQGIVLKKVFDKGENVLCTSINHDNYPDFEIPKEEIYSIGLVVGLLRTI